MDDDCGAKCDGRFKFDSNKVSGNKVSGNKVDGSEIRDDEVRKKDQKHLSLKNCLSLKKQ